MLLGPARPKSVHVPVRRLRDGLGARAHSKTAFAWCLCSSIAARSDYGAQVLEACELRCFKMPSLPKACDEENLEACAHFQIEMNDCSLVLGILCMASL